MVVFLLLPLFIFGQDSQARRQIRELKNSILLVRLRTSQPKIDALKEAGYPDKARQVEEKQLAENKEIVKAFHDQFFFCPVYFFYSHMSKEIRVHHFQGNLMDENLAAINGIGKPVPVYFVAEFGNIERSDEANFTGYSIEQDTTGKKQKTSNYSGDPDMGFTALIIRDASFVQLQKPFPYYVRTFEGFPLFTRKKNKAVVLLNKNLESYFRSASHE